MALVTLIHGIPDIVVPEVSYLNNENSINFKADNADFEIHFEDASQLDPLQINPVKVQYQQTVPVKLAANINDVELKYVSKCLKCGKLSIDAPKRIVVGNVGNTILFKDIAHIKRMLQQIDKKLS